MRLQNLDAVLTRLQREPYLLRQGVEDGLTRMSLRIVRDARKNCPVATGHLRASITYVIESAGHLREVMSRVGSNVLYAPFVELGTRRHLAPIDKMYARIYGFPEYGGRNGRNVYFRWVSGRAQPYLLPAFEANKDKLVTDLTYALRAMISTMRRSA